MSDAYEVVDETTALYRNNHGVVGEFMGCGEFVPECCWSCDRLESEDVGDYRIGSYFCLGNLMFPTKKGTCKRYTPNYWARKRDGGGEA